MTYDYKYTLPEESESEDVDKDLEKDKELNEEDEEKSSPPLSVEHPPYIPLDEDSQEKTTKPKSNSKSAISSGEDTLKELSSQKEEESMCSDESDKSPKLHHPKQVLKEVIFSF